MHKNPASTIVVGDSLLAREISSELSPNVLADLSPGEKTTEAYDFVVSASDGKMPSETRQYSRQIAKAKKVPWLPVEVLGANILIGPLVINGYQGCDECARIRRDAVREVTYGVSEVPDTGISVPQLTHPVAPAVAAIVAEEVAAVHKNRALRTDRQVIYIGLDDLSSSTHKFLPYPTCPQCSDLPEDSAEGALPNHDRHLKPSRDNYRVKDLTENQDLLFETYVDSQTGIIRKIEKATIAAYPYVAAPIAMPKMNEAGFGRDLDYRSCTLSAVTEAIERIGGARPGGRRTVVRASRAELGDEAIDPRTLGLHSNAQYAAAGFRMRPYHDDLKLNWVWGYSHTDKRPVLVPEGYAYYRAHNYGPDTTPFVYEISNGCALGGCLEEAVLYGLLELIERDSFLMTWYGRLPVPQLDLSSATDATLPLMAERLKARDGYEVYAFDTTMEHEVPSVWTMAVHPGNDPHQVKAFCAGGAGFDPEKALAAAILEMAVMIPRQSVTLANEYSRVSGMVDDPQMVKVMDDHSLLYSHPRAFDRFNFLFDQERNHSIGEQFSDAFIPRNFDIDTDLQETVDQLKRHGLNVISVDQTTSEHAAAGFSCAKVIVPGLVPMTFGYDYRRLVDLPRLFTVPQSLGYRDVPLASDQINPHPHPFP